MQNKIKNRIDGLNNIVKELKKNLASLGDVAQYVKMIYEEKIEQYEYEVKFLESLINPDIKTKLDDFINDKLTRKNLSKDELIEVREELIKIIVEYTRMTKDNFDSREVLDKCKYIIGLYNDDIVTKSMLQTVIAVIPIELKNVWSTNHTRTI